MQERVTALMEDREPQLPLTREGRRRANLPASKAEAEWRAYLERRSRDLVRVLDPAWRLRQLPSTSPAPAQGPRAASHPLGRRAKGITGELARSRPAQRARHRDQPLRQGTRRRRHLDRSHPGGCSTTATASPESPSSNRFDNIELRDAPRLRRRLKSSPGDRPDPSSRLEPKFVGRGHLLGFVVRLGDHVRGTRIGFGDGIRGLQLPERWPGIAADSCGEVRSNRRSRMQQWPHFEGAHLATNSSGALRIAVGP